MADDDYSSEGKTEGGISPYMYSCYKWWARGRKTRYIPQEMVLDILLRLPAQVLHSVMRHVCREWNLMIRSRDFIYHHLRNSTSGIIIQELDVPNGIYVEMRQGCLEICESDSGFGDVVLSGCNGLVLAPDLKDDDIYYVINPLTKQRAVLPPDFGTTGCHSFCLAFVEASMEYKVVHACADEPYGPSQIEVLTIGVDKIWRHIDIDHLPLTWMPALKSAPLVTGMYIHWIGRSFILTLNLETETFCWFPMPRLPKIYGNFLPMGSNLSLVNEPSKFLWDIWEMNPETGEWTMLLSFDSRPLNDRFTDLFCGRAKSVTPLVWLAVREVLVFSTMGLQRRFIAYNVQTRDIQSFELDTIAKPHYFQAHVKSLVQFEL